MSSVVGADHVFVIAEAGSNWRAGTPARDLAMARALVDVASEAGADAVKFQTYRPETVYVANAGRSDYLSDAGITEDITAIFADLAMPYEMIPVLADYAREQGIQFMSTPFSAADFAAVDPYVDVHKIASYEISHTRLIEMAARSGKPLIQSTGGASPADIQWAVETFRANGGTELVLLQCTAHYPASFDALNLRAIPELARTYDVTAGFSDHSRDPIAAPLAAVALGARVVEKHYTLHNRLPGPDHAFAITPPELTRMIEQIRHVEAALGDGIKRVLPEEEELRDFAQRSIQALEEIGEGDELLEGKNIGIMRSGVQRKGLHPQALPGIEGRRATRAIAAGDGIRAGDWA